MRANRSWLLAAGFILAILAPLSVLAAPLTISFKYQQGAATAVGSITFEGSLLANPGSNTFFLPDPAVLNIDMTVSGASAGNGHFVTADFNQVRFSTGGATLDFGRPLVGQPTPGGPWGTPSGCCGDFNFFSAAAPAPDGVFYFTLGANNGGANAMVLASAIGPTVPTVDGWLLAVLAVMLVTIGVAVQRRA